MPEYEALVIVDPRLDEAAIQQAVDRFTKVITEQGELVGVDNWGRRRLAFEINHLNEGHYVLAKFRAPGTVVAELDRVFRLAEEYVRAKIVRLPEQ